MNEQSGGEEMRRTGDLEERLLGWAAVYGGGRYGLQEGVKSPMGQMMKWGGRPPSGLGQEPRTPEADEVQDAVVALTKQAQGWLPAQVLRCEYWLPGQPIEAKLQRLATIGERVQRVRYYQLLRLARVHVAGWLRLPFSDEVASTDVGEMA